MKKIKQLSVGKQVLFLFGTLCAILGVIGALFFFSLRSIEGRSRENLSYVVNEAELAAAAAQNIGLMQAAILRHILAKDPAEMVAQDQTIHEIDVENTAKLAAYREFVDTPEEGRLYAIVLHARSNYLEATDEILALSRANRNTEAAELAASKQVPVYEEYQLAVKEMTGYVENEVRDIAAALDRRIARIRTVGDAFVLIAILIAIGTGFVVARVTRRLKENNGALETEITERKLVEEAMRQREERYRSLFESNPLPMWIYDVRTLLFLEVNDAAIAHYGYGRAEFLSMTIADIRPISDKPALLSAVAEASSQPVGKTSIWKHRKKDGSLIDVEITSHFLDYNGRSAELVLAFDLAERQRAERERQVISEIVQGVMTASISTSC